jgi:hypothetical protein
MQARNVIATVQWALQHFLDIRACQALKCTGKALQAFPFRQTREGVFQRLQTFYVHFCVQATPMEALIVCFQSARSHETLIVSFFERQIMFHYTSVWTTGQTSLNAGRIRIVSLDDLGACDPVLLVNQIRAGERRPHELCYSYK